MKESRELDLQKLEFEKQLAKNKTKSFKSIEADTDAPDYSEFDDLSIIRL